jgi:hypothetical protein
VKRLRQKLVSTLAKWLYDEIELVAVPGISLTQLVVDMLELPSPWKQHTGGELLVIDINSSSRMGLV